MTFGAEIITALLAMAPIGELRAAIPVGVGMGLTLWYAVVLSVIANIVAGLLLLLLLDPIASWLRKHISFFDKFFTWLFQRTRRKAASKMERFGRFIGIFILVGIPLPGTGAWTAAAAAFVFGIKFRVAFPAIVLGIFVAATITALVTAGVITIF